jgi:hypothetical protein
VVDKRVAWAIVTGEYPPQTGGVSDYTPQVALALANLGDPVHIFAPPAGNPPRSRADVLYQNRFDLRFSVDAMRAGVPQREKILN